MTHLIRVSREALVLDELVWLKVDQGGGTAEDNTRSSSIETVNTIDTLFVYIRNTGGRD